MNRIRSYFRTRGTHALVVISVVLVSAVVSVGLADERTDYLVRLLQTSTAFRVRAQAAISLGAVTAEPGVVQALSAALRDENAAVRAAAASSLGRLGDPSAIGALRALERDPEAAVRAAATEAIAALQRSAPRAPAEPSPPSVASATTTSAPAGPARYYVGIGTPGTRIASVDGSVLRTSRAFIERTVSAMPGVVIAPEDESPAAAGRAVRQRQLSGFYLDSSVTALEERPGGALRAAVSVVVQDYPGRNVRSMLTGSATVSGETGTEAQRTVIEAALGSALRNLGTAMSASARR